LTATRLLAAARLFAAAAAGLTTAAAAAAEHAIEQASIAGTCQSDAHHERSQEIFHRTKSSYRLEPSGQKINRLPATRDAAPRRLVGRE
jgi:hypothetical protein